MFNSLSRSALQLSMFIEESDPKLLICYVSYFIYLQNSVNNKYNYKYKKYTFYLTPNIHHNSNKINL